MLAASVSTQDPPGFPEVLPPVLYEKRITSKGLRQVIDGAKLALVIPKFYKPQDAEALAQRLLGAESWDTYSEQGAADVGKLGKALFDCAHKTECDLYFDSVDENRGLIQRRLHPYSNPADLVQVEADHCWPEGCTRLTIGGRKCFLGLPRAFSNGGEARPHTDRADWDWPSSETIRIQAQLAFNVYLSMTEGGGELQLWRYRPSHEEYERMRDGYGLHRHLLPPPEVTLRPNPGDLIIFNASCVHAVTPSTGKGVRVTMSGFLGFQGEGRPLVAFS
jgi:hypothetical protein